MKDFRQHSSQLIKFLIVGGLGTLVNYGVFYVLLRILGWPYLLASATGFIVGIAVGYPLNKLWTYAHKDKATLGLGLCYVAVYLFSLGLSLLTLHLLVDRLGVDARLANVVAIGLTTCTNFIGTKFLVFRKV